MEGLLTSDIKKAQELVKGGRVRRHAGGVDALDRPATRAVTRLCLGWPCVAEMEKLRDQFARET
jgi:hypothetical protein